MQKLTSSIFDQALEQGSARAIVKFYANWCPDCRRTEQGTLEISKDYAENFSFYEVNVDEEPALAAKFDVKGIPSFLVFDQGKETARLFSRDAKTKEQILNFVQLQLR